MRLNRSIWRAFLAVMLVVMPLTAVVIVPAVGAADPVLFTQATNPGLLLSPAADYAAPLDSFDAMTADDFVVGPDEKWLVTQVDVAGDTILGSDEPTSFNVFIYRNNSGVPGAQIFSATGLAYVEAIGIYSVTLPAGPTLLDGTYWLVVQANAASGENWGWRQRTVQDGYPAQFVNPGNGLGSGCATGWSPRTSCTLGSGPDQIFVLYGLQQPNLPPVNTVPSAQTVHDDVNITFSTANGNAISVDDPDAGTENLQVTLTATYGRMTLSSPAAIAALNFQEGTGTADTTMRFRGKLTEINNALNGLVYNPTDGFGGLDTLVITTNDRGNNGTGGAKTDSDTVAITVQARTQITGITGTMQYGGANANLNACLTTVGLLQPATNLSGQTITFKRGAIVLGTATTGTNGCANFTGTTLADPGLNVGFYPGQLTAEFAGSTYLLPSTGTGNLQIARRILWVKPVDREVVVKTANPPTNPNIDPACAAPNRCLELANGSMFAPGDDWSDLNLANLRFSYGRSMNGPANEKAGAKYRITALGASSSNYDIRYQPGTLTAVAP